MSSSAIPASRLIVWMIMHWKGYTGPVATLAYEMNFILNHAPAAGSIAQPADQQSSSLPLYPEHLLLIVIV